MPEQKIKCPLCFRELMVQTEWAGRIIQCPLCQGTIRLPEFQDSPAAPSYQPPAEEVNWDQINDVVFLEDEEEEKRTHIQFLANLVSGIAVLLFLVGVVLLFIKPGWGAGLSAVAIGLFIWGFTSKKRIEFVLQPGEKIILTCQLNNTGSDGCFIRITNKRVVLGAVEYPFLLPDR